ncbi:heat shock protein 30-like [Pseudorasbora parva]|uniref:heat shock protein 30-like n=1 Tax=Pseudorasbora parva TaxID=51549 RepID=UPI00351EF86E
MLSLHGFQPSLIPFKGIEERDITDVLLEARSSLEELQHEIFEEFQQKEIPCTMENGGSSFALTLDTRDFSPEELSVRQVGRKLQVSGKSQKKQEDDGKGSYSCRIREFRRVFDLPEGVNPEDVTCCSTADGKLYIQAPIHQQSEVDEKMGNDDRLSVKL